MLSFSWTEALSAIFSYSTEEHPYILGDNFHPVKPHFIIKWLSSLKCHDKRLSPVLTYVEGFSFAFFFFKKFFKIMMTPEVVKVIQQQSQRSSTKKTR